MNNVPTSGATVAQRLAHELIASARASRIDEDARHGAERVLLDSLACALGASDSPAVQAGQSDWPARPSRRFSGRGKAAQSWGRRWSIRP